MSNNTALGELVKQYRKTLGMTQEDFATVIGVDASHISAIERGIRGISLEKLIEVRKRYHVSLDGLVPVEEFDDSLKQKWIAEISEYLQAMDTTQVGVLKRMIGSMKD